MATNDGYRRVSAGGQRCLIGRRCPEGDRWFAASRRNAAIRRSADGSIRSARQLTQLLLEQVEIDGFWLELERRRGLARADAARRRHTPLPWGNLGCPWPARPQESRRRDDHASPAR